MRKSVGRLALAAGALAMVAPGVSRAADPLRLTTPVQATKDDLSPGRLYSAPSLRVDPNNPDVIVGGFAEMRTKTCGLIRSTNRGQTWKILEASPALASYPFCFANNSNIFQAPLAFGRNGVLYMATLGWDTPDTRQKTSIVLAKSTDLGDSWTPTMVRDARPTEGADQEANRPLTGLVVDASSGSADTVYITWRRQLPNRTAPDAAPAMPMVSVSTDGGKSFSAPTAVTGDVFANEATRAAALGATTTVVSNTTTTAPKAGSLAATPNQVANFGGSNPAITVDDKGTVYVAWKSATSNLTPSPPSAIFLAKSTDKGKTWSINQVSPFTYRNTSSFVIPEIVWTPAGGPSGTLHMVSEFTDRPEVAGYSDIYHLSSTDGGKTWSDLERITDDDPRLLKGKYIPNIEVAPNGRLDVAWWDTRDDPGVRTNDVYYSYSTDNGKTWAKNVRVTDQTIDRRFGVWGTNFDQSSPPSLASTNQLAVFAWDDTRLSRGEGGPVLADDPIPQQGLGAGVQDIFVSVAQFSAIGGGTSKAAKLALAGVVGLVVVGLVLLLIGLGSRRRQGDDAPDRESVAGTTSSSSVR